jgi:DNA-binding transcriptional ArsR family regulator
LTIRAVHGILKYVLNQTANLDRVFQALADPGRRLMVERLSQGPASVSELGRPLSMSLAAVVQHVQVLEISGLVRSHKVGRTRTCSINPAVLRSAEAWIAERRSLWERRLDRLGDYLADTPDDPGKPNGQPQQADPNQEEQ